MTRSSSLLLAVVIALVACGGGKGGSAKEVRVAAAADLARAFEELGAAFEKETGIEARLTFGSTGLLAKQIEEGAPFDVFAAANVSYVDQVVKAGACDGSTQTKYAQGRIVAWGSSGIPARLQDLVEPKWRKIALANPDHAPYGKAGKQALEKLGIWKQLESAGRLVFGENVQQTMQYAKSGNVDIAIVALSLAVVADGGESLEIDASLHAPLDQALAVCGKGAGTESGKKFAAYVASPAGREIMTRYGFILPGEQPATPPKKAAAPKLSHDDAKDVVDAWLAAQNAGDFAAYEALYDARFGGIKRIGGRAWRYDRTGWLADRAKMFKSKMTVELGDVDIHVTGAMAVARFTQTFTQGKFKDTGDKQLVLTRGPDGVKIAGEEMLRSTVVAGPGSAKATGLSIIDGKDGAWLVLAGADDLVGDAALVDAGAGDAFSYAVTEGPGTLTESWQKLAGGDVTVFPSGATCKLGAFRKLHLLTPHWGTHNLWRGDEDGDGTADGPPLAADALLRAIVDGGGASYLVAELGDCGDGQTLGVLGGKATPWEQLIGDAASAAAAAAFTQTPGYLALQREYETVFAGSGPWSEADDRDYTVMTWRSPDGKTTLIVVGATAGVGCGEFFGELTAVFRAEPGGKVKLVSESPYLPAPFLVDTNGDGRPELISHGRVVGWDGKSYSLVSQLDFGMRDSGC